DKNRRTRHQGKPCTSDFDYLGWERMNDWQKKVRNRVGDEGCWVSGCWNDCLFPSACRYLAWLGAGSIVSSPEGKTQDGKCISCNSEGQYVLPSPLFSIISLATRPCPHRTFFCQSF